MEEEKKEETKIDNDAKLADNKYGWNKHHHHGLKIFLGVVVLSLILGCAVFVGHFSRFERGGAQREVFIGHNSDFGGRGMIGRSFGGRHMNGQVTSGDVTKIDGSSITIKTATQDVSVTVTSTTSFQKNGSVAKQSDLQDNNYIIVYGPSDSNGVIQAQTILIK